ncbi:MAG: hypothetical protein JW908_12810 [Anaerolineales bacterium]|nr:hypothetical protein [Anaerolineales bacterium]
MIARRTGGQSLVGGYRRGGQVVLCQRARQSCARLRTRRSRLTLRLSQVAHHRRDEQHTSQYDHHTTREMKLDGLYISLL